MFGPKIPVVAATVGFVLSFLIGLFSGAAFPVFLFRAVIMALFFAAVAVGVHLLIKRFLPELLGGAGTAADDQVDKTTGSVVDLTVGDQEESPVLSFGNSGIYAGREDISADDAEPLDNAEEGRDSSLRAESDTIPGNPQPAAAVTTALEEDKIRPADGDASDTVTEAASGVVSQPRQKPKGAAAGLDVLPDLQDFIPEKKPESDDDADDDLPVEPVVHGFSVPDVTTDVVETETMAKAIRTILSKDN